MRRTIIILTCLTAAAIVISGQWFWNKQIDEMAERVKEREGSEGEPIWSRESGFERFEPEKTLSEIIEVHDPTFAGIFDEYEQGVNQLFLEAEQAYYQEVMVGELSYDELVTFYRQELNQFEDEMEELFYLAYGKLQDELERYGYDRGQVIDYELTYELIAEQSRLQFVAGLFSLGSDPTNGQNL
ncbi:hypothetical protein [Desertibacillus haloalkaliphilus]|uniref:hypothetical protein n=1 Tax=Desertibacillus haloalkaliphilus TaxID=1328930 RepID=UPI001C271DAF|nr:hypothetical protein [Desertibacillus haloalkaliphilus]MBU8905945.1 hypothetical protein [Desertibacillus haloalkaliphilus]